jgi:hypothetical protein
MQQESELRKILKSKDIEVSEEEAKDIEGLLVNSFGIYLGKIADSVVTEKEYKLIESKIIEKNISNEGYRQIIDKLLERKLGKTVDEIYTDFLNLIIDGMISDAKKAKELFDKVSNTVEDENKRVEEFERTVLDIIEQQGQDTVNFLGIENV